MSLIYLTLSGGLPQTKSGVTLSNGGNHKINVSGTSTATSQFFVFFSRTSLPTWFKFDTNYDYNMNRNGSGLITLQLRMYDRNGNNTIIFEDSGSGTFNVPSSAGYVGMSLNFHVLNRAVLTGSITPTIEEWVYISRFNSIGLRTDPHYTTRNPFYIAGFGMPNCTCYAFGRAWEISDPNDQYINYPPLSHGNGQDFYPHNDNWPRSQTPALGAIACYAGGNYSGLGHVCVVEEIDNVNRRCRVSESAWNGYFFRSTHWIDFNGNYGYGGYTFQGYILNPYAGTDPGTPTPPLKEGRKLWFFKRAIERGKGNLII